jgi:alkylation response protein AidB-like acyl-CoA dehydrogenase
MQKAVALYDGGAPGAAEDSNVAKYAAGDPAINCVDRAIHAYGGNGFALEHGLSDMWWGAPHAHRAGLPRDDPQLRGRAFAGPPKSYSARGLRPSSSIGA